jgi:hypothetical protein
VAHRRLAAGGALGELDAWSTAFRAEMDSTGHRSGSAAGPGGRRERRADGDLALRATGQRARILAQPLETASDRLSVHDVNWAIK